MTDITYSALLGAAVLNGLAGLIHLWAIWSGANAYRALGAGETLAVMVENGRLYPHILTAMIAGALLFFALLALSLAGVVRDLPFAREILWLLTGVYLLRGVYPLLLAPFSDFFRSRFMILTSLIVLVFAAFHWVGLTGWDGLMDVVSTYTD